MNASEGGGDDGTGRTSERSTARVIGTGNSSNLDWTALASMQGYRADELSRVQARADKWIAGLTAITGLLTTVVVVKGTESFTDLADKRKLFGIDFSTQVTLIVLMGLGAVLLVASILLSYMAAHGTPLEGTVAEEVATQAWDMGALKDTTPAVFWFKAINSSIEKVRTKLTLAVIGTVVGLACLAAALVFAWTTPEANSGTGTCLQTPTGLVKLSEVPVVKSGTVTVTACPN